MKKNMGGMDRRVRIIVALAIGVLTFTGVLHGTLAIVLLLFVAVFLLTGFVSFCPLYAILGFNTCKR
ncbi:MAG: YgaP family membrane protein [Flavobacteriales bacterium]